MDELLKAKSDQAIAILKKLEIDLWMIMSRESSVTPEPSMPLVAGGEVVWTSFFLFTSSGRKIALVGNFDVPLYESLGHFDEVRGYVRGVREDLLALLGKLRPRKIAINYSIDYHMADGLTYGLYLHLLQLLRGTPYESMIVSAESVQVELRSIKLPEEQARIREACLITEKLFGSLRRRVRAGMSGHDIYDFLQRKVKALGLEFSFAPTISIGAKTPVGHAVCTEDVLEQGEILHIDFGVVCKDYCSDIQRIIYLLKAGEIQPPEQVRKAFETVSGIIRETARQAVPGQSGYAIDAIAREILRERGYSEYQHALGHQLGRGVHDGGTILGPRWERYGKSPLGTLMEGQVFTLELEISLDKIGVVGLEEDVVIEAKGARFLSKPQRSLVCV